MVYEKIVSALRVGGLGALFRENWPRTLNISNFLQPTLVVKRNVFILQRHACLLGTFLLLMFYLSSKM